MFMRQKMAISLVLLVVCSSPTLRVGWAKEAPAKTALDEYVAAADDSYRWRIVKEKSADRVKTVVIDMVSQTWRDHDDVDRPEWQHWLTVTLPKEPKSNIGMLFIGGGRNGGDPPNDSAGKIRSIAQATGTVVAELHMVPNQPLVFHNDGQPRTEDDLIGYTWDQFLKTGDPTWPARNPMVKSAVRAMDTITALTTQEYGEATAVDQFVVAGGSKRGWTTWLTGAVDPRVVAIIPIVIDVLNLQASVNHHFAAYGFWAPSIGDYIQHNIPQRRDHPRMQQLFELVDPFHYRHRLTMPKFIVNASGDQFFPPDSSRFYFAELRGEKHLRYVPNADHGLDGSDAIESIVAYYSLVLAGQKAPRFTWTNSHDGIIEVTATDKPKEVRLWHATNPEARDFRMESLGAEYKSQLLEDQGDGRYVAEVSTPSSGWTAYFVELTYDVLGKVPLKLTTDVGIVPNVLPHENKDATLPATITVRCICPSAAVASAIQQSIRASELPGVDGEMRSADRPSDDRSGAVRLTLNWSPAGRIESSARAVTGWLSEKGCNEFSYQLDSGPRNVYRD